MARTVVPVQLASQSVLRQMDLGGRRCLAIKLDVAEKYDTAKLLEADLSDII